MNMTDEDIEEFYKCNKEKIDRIIEMKAEQEKKSGKDDGAGEAYEDDFRHIMGTIDGLCDVVEDVFGRYAERASPNGGPGRHGIRDGVKHYRGKAEEKVGEKLSFLSDPELQRHVIGAGMEIIAAMGAFIRCGPFPESVKNAVNTGNMMRNEEFCGNNPDCRARTAAKKEDATGTSSKRAVKIEVRNRPGEGE